MLCQIAILAWCSAVLASHHPAILGTGTYPPPLRIKYSKETIFNATNVLPDDSEMTTVITNGNSSYYYLHGAYGPLTLVIRPCGVSINVTIYHVPQQSTGLLKDSIQGRSHTCLGTTAGSRAHVFSRQEADAGLYLLDLVTDHRRAVVTMYATGLPSVPAALRITQHPRVRIQPRLHRNRITLRWDQSVVDPQMMHYCVAVNSRRNFSSYCEASNASGLNVRSMSVDSHKIENRIHKTSSTNVAKKLEKNLRTSGQQLGKNDMFITCVGAGLSYTISNLRKGQEYYFNIFARNRQTELTFLYASKAIKYDPKLQPRGLHDNKPIKLNIRRLGGRALLRYKVSATHNYDSDLSWYVMPCGGAVDVEVSVHRQVVIPRQTVEGYRHFHVSSPKPGQRYMLFVTVPDPQQMKQIMGLEVLATMRASILPQLPAEATVYEYSSLRTCNSVTVGWIPVASQYVRYCVSATLVPLSDLEGHFRPHPNQCNLDSRLHNHFDFAVKHCQDFSQNDHRSVLVETVTKLRPGKEYVIQVTVKKIKGKALSYDLLRVKTKSVC